MPGLFKLIKMFIITGITDYFWPMPGAGTHLWVLDVRCRVPECSSEQPPAKIRHMPGQFKLNLNDFQYWQV